MIILALISFCLFALAGWRHWRRPKIECTKQYDMMANLDAFDAAVRRATCPPDPTPGLGRASLSGLSPSYLDNPYLHGLQDRQLANYQNHLGSGLMAQQQDLNRGLMASQLMHQLNTASPGSAVRVPEDSASFLGTIGGIIGVPFGDVFGVPQR